MRRSLLSLFTAVMTASLWASGLIEPVDLLERSELWPAFVRFVDEGGDDAPSSPVPSGVRGVLVRLEQDENGQAFVLADFGRYGVHRVPIEATDFIAQAEAIASGASSKDQPNYISMIAGRLVSHHDDRPKQVNPRSLELLERKGFLFCYSPLGSDTMPTLGEALADHPGLAEEWLVVFVPDTSINDAEMHQRLSASGLGAVHTYFEFLRDGYRASLVHCDEKAPDACRWVATDLEGLIEARSESDNLKEGLHELVTRLH